MTSQVSISNRALLGVGARAQVSSIDPSDGSTEADALSLLWTPTFEQLGRAAPWNCLRAQKTLTLLQAASGTPENPNGDTLPIPPTPWLYAYQYPSDCLLFRFIVPSLPSSNGDDPPPTSISNAAGSWVPNSGMIPFAIATDEDLNGSPISVVLTNQSQAQAIYNRNLPNPALWDSLFQQAMVSALGAFLVPALSLNFQLMNMAIATAEKVIHQARTQDGNEGVTTMDHLPDWIRARAGAQGYGLGYNFTNWGGYVNPSWPVYNGNYFT